MDIPLPRLDSSKLKMESVPRELFGVGIGVAAVRMMIGGGKLPRESTCPFADIIREYIFNSASDNCKRAIHFKITGRRIVPNQPLTYCIMENYIHSPLDKLNG